MSDVGKLKIGERSVVSEEQESQKAKQEEDVDVRQFVAFLRTALMPMLVLKSLLLYFGIHYSNYPGEGYGWGLIGTIALSFASFSWFIWSQTRDENK